jgi:hypothetical protein
VELKSSKSTRWIECAASAAALPPELLCRPNVSRHLSCTFIHRCIFDAQLAPASEGASALVDGWSFAVSTSYSNAPLPPTLPAPAPPACLPPSLPLRLQPRAQLTLAQVAGAPPAAVFDFTGLLLGASPLGNGAAPVPQQHAHASRPAGHLFCHVVACKACSA